MNGRFALGSAGICRKRGIRKCSGSSDGTAKLRHHVTLYSKRDIL